MVSFFKNFGKGVLYVLVLPFLLVGMALYAVVAFFVFLFLSVKGIILFFTGRSLYEDLPEDIEAKRRLAPAQPTEQTSVTNEDISSALNGNEQETNKVNTADPFYVPEYLKSEPEQVEEPVQEEPVFEEPEPEYEPEPEPAYEPEPEAVFDESPVQEEEPVIKPNYMDEPDVQDLNEDEIILEKTEQKSNILEIKADDMDDEESSGVNIDFD